MHQRETSFQQAEIVETAILDKLEGLKTNPEKHPKDKYKKNNDGHFRAFETHSFRVAYKYSDKEIRVLRIRHVKQEPKSY
ncbi:MAG: type II toxin-antitoxin system RelE/ParE family toxin [Cyclobacteriaceae bacterium]